jgi:hypothetical protein
MRTLLLVVLMITVLPRAYAQPAQCVLDSRSPVLSIDARNGRISQDPPGKTQFKPGESLQLQIVNKNPFVYEYTVKIDEQPISESPVATFLSLLTPGAIALLAPQGEERESAERTAAAARAVNPGGAPVAATQGLMECSADAAWRGRVWASRNERLLPTPDDVANWVNQAVQPLSRAKARWDEDRPKLQSDNATCATLVAVADTLVKDTNVDSIDALLGRANGRLNDTRKTLVGYQSENTLLATELGILERDNRLTMPCVIESREILRTSALAYDGMESILDRGADSLAKQRTSLNEIVAAKKGAQEVLDRADAFGETQVIGGQDTPTRVTVSLQRKARSPADAATKTLVTRELSFGGKPRFTLGVGMFFADLESNQFGKVQTITGVDADGAPTIGNVIENVDHSDGRRAAMILLHSRLTDRWHLSLGFAADTDANEDDSDLFLGASWSFANDQAFLSFGPYRGRIQSLGGGFEEGDTIPDEIGAVPVRNEHEFGFAIGLTYGVALSPRAN